MLYSIAGGLISLLTGVAVLVHWRREVFRRPADFMARHAVYEGKERPRVQVKNVGRGTSFVNVGAVGKFRPPEDFENMEVLIEKTRRQLSPLKWLGLAFVALGVSLLAAGILAAAILQ